VINVALGGKLYQDIATQCGDQGATHRDEAKYDNTFHEMRILPNTWLARIYPQVQTKRINSIHHHRILPFHGGRRECRRGLEVGGSVFDQAGIIDQEERSRRTNHPKHFLQCA